MTSVQQWDADAEGILVEGGQQPGDDCSMDMERMGQCLFQVCNAYNSSPDCGDYFSAKVDHNPHFLKQSSACDLSSHFFRRICHLYSRKNDECIVCMRIVVTLQCYEYT